MRGICFICGRKASRRCIVESALAHGGPESSQRRICSECCGKGRGRSIDCPDRCPHYRTGAKAALFKLALLGEDPEMEIRYSEVLHNLRLGMARVCRGRLRDLADREVRQALANVADTMRARSSGLILDFKSTDPRVDMLGKELLSVAALHERGEKGMAKTDAAELMKCIKYMEKQAATAEKQGRKEALFLDLICQAVSREYVVRGADGLVQA